MESSACNKLFEDLLITYYTPLEVWYLRSAVDKVLPFLYFALHDAKVTCRRTAFRPQTRLHHQLRQQHLTTHSTSSRSSFRDFFLPARLESSSGRPELCAA